MNLIITAYNNRNICAWYEDKSMIQADIIDNKNCVNPGDIYIGKVKNIVSNINAVFIDIGNGRQCFMQVNDRIKGAPALRRNGELVKIIREMDIPVQYVRDGIKSKQPSVSSDIELAGRYMILKTDNNLISVSAKIKNKARRKELISWIEEDEYAEDKNIEEGCTKNSPTIYKGYIIRTNAENITKDVLLTEKKQLDSMYEGIIRKSAHADTYSCIYRAPDEYMGIIRDGYTGQIDRIITDKPDIYASIRQYISINAPELLNRLELYKDEYSLSALYNIEKNINRALSRKVWLDSGAYIIIEPTEACTVIDVNSGKAIAGKKNKEDTIYKINTEAAKEIIKQLRLRNISGIIIIDYVDMESEAHREELMSYMRELTDKEPVKTTVVDMTALGLVELTRHKRKKSLAEQLN